MIEAQKVVKENLRGVHMPLCWLKDFGINSLCPVQNLDITPKFGCATRFHILVLDWSEDKRLGQMSMISVRNPSSQFFGVGEAIIKKNTKEAHRCAPPWSTMYATRMNC